MTGGGPWQRAGKGVGGVDKAGNGKGEDKLRHVGGVSEELGGVDPDIDQTLMRLSGGP